MLQIRSSLAMLLVIIMYCSCKKDVKEPARAYVVRYNYNYGPDTTEQNLDLYLPTQRRSLLTPVAVLLHGGAWVQGNKRDWDVVHIYNYFTSNGIAIVNMNYRVDAKYAYPATINDMDTVMAVIRRNAVAWQIDPNRICMVGRSSGGQLALYYAYAHNTSHAIRVVLECCGPTDLTDPSVVRGPLGVNVTNWLGAYGQNQQLWHDNSPIYYMKNAVPTVILQGLADPLVYPIQSQMLYDSLQSRGVPALFFGWPGSGHGWNLDLWPPDSVQTMQWIKNFL